MVIASDPAVAGERGNRTP